MLKCRDVAHQASDYIDNNMRGWELFRFRLHLFICFYCRRFVRHVRITRDFVRSRPMPKASSAEIETVMKAVQKTRD